MVNGAELRMPLPENVNSTPEDCAGAEADAEAAAAAADLAALVTVTAGAGAAAAVTVTVVASDGLAVFPAPDRDTDEQQDEPGRRGDQSIAYAVTPRRRARSALGNAWA